MKQHRFTVHDVVKITGISRRTLHYYDSIHLLKPTEIADNGYRLYDREALARLQIILILKDLQVPLKDIADILQLPRVEQQQLLVQHQKALLQQKQQLEFSIERIDQWIHGAGWHELTMPDSSSLIPLQQQYETEAELLYGHTEVYQQFHSQLDAEANPSIRQQTQNDFENAMESIYQQLAELIYEPIELERIGLLIAQWKALLETQMPCDAELLTCIAQTYVEDIRFVNYFDSYADGFATFLHRAIILFIEKCREDEEKATQNGVDQ